MPLDKIPALLFIFLALSLNSCAPLVSEFSDSSGCLWTEGGPIPGMASGKVLVCRSGKDRASVTFTDGTKQITINHGEDSDLKTKLALLEDKVEKIMHALSAMLKAMSSEAPKKESAF